MRKVTAFLPTSSPNLWVGQSCWPGRFILFPKPTFVFSHNMIRLFLLSWSACLYLHHEFIWQILILVPQIVFLLKVTAAAEQSYGYYSGNDGTDKDPQVVNPLILPCIIWSVSSFIYFGTAFSSFFLFVCIHVLNNLTVLPISVEGIRGLCIPPKYDILRKITKPGSVHSYNLTQWVLINLKMPLSCVLFLLLVGSIDCHTRSIGGWSTPTT